MNNSFSDKEYKFLIEKLFNISPKFRHLFVQDGPRFWIPGKGVGFSYSVFMMRIGKVSFDDNFRYEWSH